ncbi:helix-turn-helix transcriptional regulator, partial [Streptomyces celluloflavus]
MSETSARLLNLLSLLQTPREWPGRELAERLRVTPRTIRRDIGRLRELGYPVHATMGADGGYRLAAGTAMPPLLLDDEEAVAIAVGLRSAAGHAIEGIEEASVRALAKLEQVLPARLRRRVGTLGTATVPMPAGDDPTVDPEHLTVLAAAVTNHERVRFRYRAGAGARRGRLGVPHRGGGGGGRGWQGGGAA